MCPIFEPTNRPAPDALPTKQEFRDVMGRFASGVTVITTHHDGADFGSTVSAITSLTDEPPMLLVCLNRNSSTGQAVKESGTLAVNVLAEDHVDLASRFASRSPEKFADVPIQRAHHQAPLLEGAIAHLICTVHEQVEAGTHFVFLATVKEVLSTAGHPLAYFRGKFGRMQTAPEVADLHKVRQWITSAGTNSEQTIDVPEMAHKLDLDRNALERCLVALTHEGMILRDGGQFRIHPLPNPVIFESYAARLAIDLGVAASTINTATEEQITELRRLMENTLDLVDGDRFTDVDAWIEANEAFHEYMVRMAGSSILLETYLSLNLPGLNRRTLTDASLADPCLLEDHRQIVKAYEQRDLSSLMTVLRTHANRPREIRTRETTP